MTYSRRLSQQARTVLSALLDSRDAWSYGYELSRVTGVKSGTLYPLLVRLESRGYLEAEWQPAAEGGRPPRHAYRLTSAGLALARENPPSRSSARTGLGKGALA